MRVLSIVIVIIASVLLLQSCDKDDLKEVVSGLGDMAEAAGKSTIANPEFIAAYTRGGWSEARKVGLPIFWSNIKIQAQGLDLETKVGRKLYELIMEESPLVARMIQRESPLGTVGIWPDLVTAAQSVGYENVDLGIVFQLTPEQWDWVGENIGQLAVLHYNAVKAEDKAMSPVNEGIETGGDW
jgi:hypothetical protein